jgi:diguanylate cyclase (GGDEF)-like protein
MAQNIFLSLSVALNSILGSCLILILIFVDYSRKFNTDPFQRSLFLAVLGCVFVPMLGDFFYYMAAGNPGRLNHILLVISLNLYYVFQIAAFYLFFVLIDYLTLNDKVRTKKILFISKCIIVIHALILVLNFRFHFYFSVSPENLFVREGMFFIRIIISYFPLLVLLFEFFFYIRQFNKIRMYLSAIFFVLTAAGSIFDIVLDYGALTWPCLSAALLYTYFFIIKADSKIDSLTGIGNRYAFNEFISGLSRQTAKQSYSIVMIDMDHFKEINDTLGHLEGDNALRDMAAIIKASIRSNDFAARYGGDEFILAAKADFNINQIMDRLKASIANQNSKGVRPYKIEISYGVDVFTTHGDQSIEEFMAHIDSLMYENKAEHRGRRRTDNR